MQGTFLCPGLDSNQHALSSTTTSRWLVYQFQHLGIPLKGCKSILFFQNNSKSCAFSYFRLFDC